MEANATGISPCMRHLLFMRYIAFYTKQAHLHTALLYLPKRTIVLTLSAVDTSATEQPHNSDTALGLFSSPPEKACQEA